MAPESPSSFGERLRRANRASVATAICLMVWILLLNHLPDVPEGFVHRSALMLVAVHVFSHALSVRGLGALSARGMQEAATMLAIYRHPRRISHADLAVAWSAFYLASRVFGAGSMPAPALN